MLSNNSKVKLPDKFQKNEYCPAVQNGERFALREV